MNHCNLSVRAPWFGMLYARRNAGAPLADFPRHLYSHIVCELARGHEGEHADYLGEMSPDVQVWVRWDGGQFTYVCVRPCEMVDPAAPLFRQDACSLFVGHGPGHSWELTDPLHG